MVSTTFTLIDLINILIINSVMAESHVFIIRQEQIKGEKGSRSPFVFFAFICLTAFVSTAADVNDSPTIEVNSHYAQLNKVIKMKCTFEYVNEMPLINWHLPNDVRGFLHYVTQEIINEKKTIILLLIFYEVPKNGFINVRCTSRFRNLPLSLAICSRNIQIYSKPRLISSNYQWQFGVGGKAIFNCKFNANPMGLIEWYKNDDQLDADQVKYITNNSESQSKLEINGIIYTDYANYTCKCENSIGKSNKTFEIKKDYGRLNDYCYDNFDCFVENSICNLITKICECRKGFKQLKKSLKKIEKCTKVVKLNEKCDGNENCVNKFSHCNNGFCQCDSNYVGIKTNSSNLCYQIVRDLFTNCILDQQCLIEGSKCIENRCFCDDFHKPYWKNGSCIRKTFLFSSCSDDLCQRGGFAYSICINNTCRCLDGYYYNQFTHHCEGSDLYGFVLFFMFSTVLSLYFIFLCVGNAK